MEIKFMESNELEHMAEVIEGITDIYLANNYLYSPTLSERFNADNDEELRVKLKSRIYDRVIAGYNFYLIYEDGELIGFNNHKVGYDIIKGVARVCVEIGTTCVEPQHQNKGYGKELYAVLDREAVERYNAEAVIRTTWSTNTRQVHLYTLYGYRVYIQKFDFYGFEGVDSLHFYKLLNEEEGY